MRTITIQGQTVEVEIVSLTLPRSSRLVSRGHPIGGGEPNLMMISPKELPIGAQFQLPNAADGDLLLRVLGCAPHARGRFLVLGVVVG